MSKKYLVVVEEPCPRCGGTGVITNPMFEDLWDRYESARRTGAAEGISLEEWAEANGYTIPDEEIECLECEGSGKIRREVLLLEALKELGVYRGDEVSV